MGQGGEVLEPWLCGENLFTGNPEEAYFETGRLMKALGEDDIGSMQGRDDLF